MPCRATEDRIAAALAALPGWQRCGDTIARTFVFADFVAAFAFMTDLAEVAESAHHHPDWRNVYRRVEIAWSTHDVGGLSERDFAMARRCDELAAAHGAAAG